MVKIKVDSNYIKFLGTAGARFVMIKQLRHSGGLWISSNGVNILVDPGPGSLVRCLSACPRLDPQQLDAIILTHKHLDHSNDINVMIEAMTQGGYKKKGTLFCPQDALDGEDAVVFKYLRGFPEKIELLKPCQEYNIGDFKFSTSMQHQHRAETYGLKFVLSGKSVGLMTDTKYFPQLEDFYKVDVLVMGVVFDQPRPEIDHLSLEDARMILSRIRPKQGYLTHFGLRMLSANPDLAAKKLSRELGLKITAAKDGMVIR